MFLWRKNTIKFFQVLFLTLFTAIIVDAQTPGNRIPKKPFTKKLTTADSIKQANTPNGSGNTGSDSLSAPTGDSLVNVTDTFSVNFSKDSLDAPIKREAIDSAIFLVKEKKFILYGKALAEYKDNKVEAAFIELDNDKNTMRARAQLDSAGLVSEQVKMLTGGQTVLADSLLYNVKNGKGISYNSRTQTDDMFVISQKIKLLGDRKTFFGFNNLFTTCNLDVPHFAFHAQRIKVINEELAVSGFARPEFEGVPVPVGIPFGIYPMKRGRHSGFIMPEFTANEDLGIGLTGGGYYKVINDYWDIMLQSNLYSYGSWNIIATPSYRKRYKYQGRFTINIQNTKQNFKGDADFTKNRSFNVGWNHTADTRARPGVNFSANINAGKSSFNQYNPNSPFSGYNNQLYSSITWSKTWTDANKPFNLTVSANHNQNANLNVVSINLPEINFSVQTQYPFQRKNPQGPPHWYEKIGVSYNGNLRSQMAFKDNEPIGVILRTLIDTFQWGATHSIPITLSLPSLGALQVSPSITYEERTYGQKTFMNWNDTKRRVDTSTTKGIYEARQMSFGVGFTTALFGTFNLPKRKSGVVAIRHVIRPQMGIQYTPNFNKRNYYDLQVDTVPRNGVARKIRTSYYTGNIYSPFSEIEYGGINFGLDNNIELKTRSRKDTSKSSEKKVKLIDGFGFSSGYNFLEDSMRLQAFTFYLRSSIADGKINITGGAQLDPYQLNKNGDRINKYTWEGQKLSLSSLGRFTGASISIGSQFRGGDKQNKKVATDKLAGAGQSLEDLTPDEQQRMMEYVRTHPAEFADFNVPWNFGVQMAINVSRTLQPDYSYKTDFFVNANFNGDFNLTPKWKVGTNGFYDFKAKKIQSLQMYISREMHCWQLSINIVPVGYYRSFNISLNPKAGILRDLKINRTRFFYSN
jgi:LPS-assembly protein